MGKWKVLTRSGKTTIPTIHQWIPLHKHSFIHLQTCSNFNKQKTFLKLVVVQENYFRLFLTLNIQMPLIMPLMFLKEWLMKQKKDFRLISPSIKANFHLINGCRNSICYSMFKMDKMSNSNKISSLIESSLIWSYVMLMILKKCSKTGIRWPRRIV